MQIEGLEERRDRWNLSPSKSGLPLEALGELVGETATEEVLNRIFEKFCIGK